MSASIVEQARLELRTGARRCYLMAAQLREALGLPGRPSLMPAEDPEAGLCVYCGEVLPRRRMGRRVIYCSSTCEFNTSRLRSLESGAVIRGSGPPQYSLIDREAFRASVQAAARLMARGADWHMVAQELGLGPEHRQSVRDALNESRAQEAA